MPESRLEAAIWDMDGVIADTAPYHYRSWRQTFRKRGVEFTWEDFRHNFGKRNDTIIRYGLGDSLSQPEVDAIAVEKDADFRRRAARHISPLPGAVELLKALKKSGIKLAIGSSAPLENVRLITGALGIEGLFQAVVWGREVTEGKPSPQGFLLAASRLGVEPGNCIVLEDAVAGVAAARRAGMKCLAVTNTHPTDSLKEADLVVDSLEAVSVADLQALFRQAGLP